MLKVLKKYHPQLPLHKTTLLKSDLNFKKLIRKFNPDDPLDKSKFVYIGIEKNLKNQLSLEKYKSDLLRLQIGVDDTTMDGLPPFKSSSIELYPILGKVFDKKIIFKPFTIAIYCGEGSPKPVSKFLSDFVDELNLLIETGIVIGSRSFKIQVHCFICNRPARSIVKCIVNHGGFFACERCMVEGVSFKNRVVYSSTSSAERTDEDFRNQINPQHHQGTSPLTGIRPKINMVKDFVLDFMHLFLLGIIKKLLNGYWICPGGILKKSAILRVSQRLMNLSAQVPIDFQRTTRSLGIIAKWKATEFRFFLLYCGIFIMMDILPDDHLKHFILLHVISRILSCEALLKKYANQIKEYLNKFVLLAQGLYGLESQILNVHSLTHVADDIKHFGCSVSHINAFPFENYLAKMKRWLSSGYKPLEQICNRLQEEFSQPEKTLITDELSILKSIKKNNVFNIFKLKYMHYEIHTKEPNNSVYLDDGSIIKIEKMTSASETFQDISVQNICVYGKKFEIIGPAYQFPCNSLSLETYIVKESEKKECEKFLFSQIKCKGVVLKIFELESDEKKIYAMPFLH